MLRATLRCGGWRNFLFRRDRGCCPVRGMRAHRHPEVRPMQAVFLWEPEPGGPAPTRRRETWKRAGVLLYLQVSQPRELKTTGWDVYMPGFSSAPPSCPITRRSASLPSLPLALGRGEHDTDGARALAGAGDPRPRMLSLPRAAPVPAAGGMPGR